MIVTIISNTKPAPNLILITSPNQTEYWTIRSSACLTSSLLMITERINTTNAAIVITVVTAFNVGFDFPSAWSTNKTINAIITNKNNVPKKL